MKKRTNIKVSFDRNFPWPKTNFISDLAAPRKIRKIGLKSTRPRKDLFNLFLKYRIPLTVEMIQNRLIHKDYNHSTIYRVLESFEKVGFIKRVDLRTNSLYYELSEKHHHHIICSNCGIIEEIEGCLIENILPKSEKFSMISEHSLEFFGKCKTCIKKT